MARNTFYGTDSNYYNTIRLVSGDTLPEINITLKDSNTAAPGATLDPSDPATWAIMDLSTALSVKMNFRKIGDTTIHETITCSVVGDGSAGNVIMRWTATSLADISGDYEGEIVVNYTGDKVTVADLLKFDVRAGF